jgi:hypothetical protein
MAYLSAINVHDAKTMSVLSTSAFAEREQGGSGAIVCDWNISDIKIVGVYDDRDPSGRFRQVVNVSLFFDLRQRHETPDMPSGRRDWGYWLGRNDPAERWLIYDSGVG